VGLKLLTRGLCLCGPHLFKYDYRVTLYDEKDFPHIRKHVLLMSSVDILAVTVHIVGLGGLVVIVLTTEPKVHGFKPGQ
jgi:hypothetical protein